MGIFAWGLTPHGEIWDNGFYSKPAKASMLKIIYQNREFEIGKKYRFVYPEIVEGKAQAVHDEGVLLSIHLDPRRRVMAHMLRIEGNPEAGKVNVDLSSLDPTEDYMDAMVEMADMCNEATAEGNARAAEVVKVHNERIERLWDEVLGKPIAVEGQDLEPVNKLAA